MNVASGILPIAEDTGKICLAWRSSRVNKGNCWGVIGGMCKAGSSPEDNAVVELIEETGYNGPIKLYKAFVCQLRGFEYHNFIGVVPEIFYFNPEPLYALETSFLQWMSYPTVLSTLKAQPVLFHKGLIALFNNLPSQTLIEKLVYETQKTNA